MLTQNLISIFSHRLLFFTLFVVSGTAQLLAQKGVTYSPAQILQMINRQEAVTLEGATITGTLDFTLLEKQHPSGSYGVRNGQVKRFTAKVKQPLVLKNCTIQGGIRTTREEQNGRLLKEYFTAFDAALVLENCTFQGPLDFEEMAFYGAVVLKNCTFQERVRFEKVHFAIAPTEEGNAFKKQLSIQDTNWNEEEEKLVTPTPKEPDNRVQFTLRNTSLKPISIKFGQTVWNLSPVSTSSLLTEPGQDIYLLYKGKKERLLLTVKPELQGQTVDVAKL